MKRSDEKLAVAEVGDMLGKPRERTKAKMCKFKGCTTLMNSYHLGKYCHIHESKAFMQASQKKLISSNVFWMR